MFRRSQTPGRTADQLLLMRRAGLLVGQTLELLRGEVRPGVTTLALDALAEDFIRSHGGIPNFQLVPGYAHTLCTSVNDEVVHGIPSSSRVLREGDLVSVDCGAELEGWNGDAAFSAVVGGRLYAVGEAVEASIESAGAADGREYGIIEEYVGHTIGRSMHEDPQIPNYAVRDKGPTVRAGFTGAIEPMVTLGGSATRVLADDWTVATNDGSRAAHWEHSVAVTDAGLTVLTAVDGGAARLGEAHVRIDV